MIIIQVASFGHARFPSSGVTTTINPKDRSLPTPFHACILSLPCGGVWNWTRRASGAKRMPGNPPGGAARCVGIL